MDPQTATLPDVKDFLVQFVNSFGCFGCSETRDDTINRLIAYLEEIR